MEIHQVQLTRKGILYTFALLCTNMSCRLDCHDEFLSSRQSGLGRRHALVELDVFMCDTAAVN